MAESWQLKLDRAEKHAQELRAAIEQYTEARPYTAVRFRKPRCSEHPDCLQYKLRIVQQPDPSLSVILGDALHNARSALDHLAVAIAPAKRRRSAGFPIERVDEWDWEDDEPIIKSPEVRARFDSKVKGMPAEAVRIIKEFQAHGEHSETHGLYLLSRFENADKHRRLLMLTSGFSDVVTTVEVRGDRLLQPMPEPGGGKGLVDDGVRIVHAGYGAPLLDEEVEVEIGGTLLVTLQVVNADKTRGVRGGQMSVVDMLDGLLHALRAEVFPALEPCVRPRRF